MHYNKGMATRLRAPGALHTTNAARRVLAIGNRTALLVATLFALALGLRVWSLGWGLPYVEHPDEPSLLQTALRMVRNGDANPQRFDKPSFFFYLLAAATQLHLWWGTAQGLYTSAQDLPSGVGLFTPTPSLFVANRLVTALLGALTVPLLYLLGRVAYGRRAGLLAALALSVAYFHLEHSAYITTDVPSAVGVVLALLGACMLVRGDGRWAYLLCGAGAGLAAGTKYNAGVAVLALLLAHLLRPQASERSWRGLALGFVAAGVAFLFTTPYALLDAPAFARGLLRLDDNYGGDSVTLLDRANLLLRRTGDYASFFWGRSLFASGCLLLVLGLPLLLRRAPRPTLVLLAVILAELVGLALYKVHFMRNVLAVFPLIVLLAAAGAVALADLVPGRAARRFVLALLAVALLTPQLQRSAWLLHYVRQPHTLAVAANDLRALPRGMRAAVESNPVQWSGDPVVFPVERVEEHTAAWYRANGFRYLLVNDERRTPEERAAYDTLVAQAQVLTRYPDRSAGLQPGPGGALLDLGVDAAAMSFVPKQARFGDGIELLGYEARPGPLRAQNEPLDGADERVVPTGSPVQINLYWRALTPIDRDYTLFVHVFDAEGQRVAQRDLPPRHEDYPPSRWQPGELVVDRADLALPALPPGAYRVALGLYDAASGARLPVTGTDGIDVADGALTLMTIEVE
jgi:4-amino-4-deoxy-L-arabinose transferase-like glycosyltransferase